MLNKEKHELLGWWIVHTTVQPAAARVASWSQTALAMNESKPLVGSSAKITDELLKRSLAMQSRFFSPPEIDLPLHAAQSR